MGLTLEVEQKLEQVGLIAFFDGSDDIWKGLAKEAYDYTRKTYPDGAVIRHDDVAKALIPVLAVHPKLGAFLRKEQIRGKHWIDDFGDYVLEKVWNEIQPQKGG
jgi:hypothetical protein